MDVTELLEDEEALRYEEEISRNPYLLESWVKYLTFKKKAKPRARYMIYERALKCLPRSYKLWRQYLQERTAALKGKSVADRRYGVLVNTYERALVHMHKMPRVWLDFCELLMALRRGTLTRRTFDRALQALPVTQHDRVWTLYLEWVEQFGVNETAVKVYRRYLMFDPAHREAFVDYLAKIGNFEEAASQLAVCVNDDDFISPQGHSKHQLWMRLCDMCARHPLQVSQSLKVDAIIRSGLARFTDEVGALWCKLADYYIRMGQFERARDIFEEAVGSVVTVRDFTTIFDTYAQFEESVLSAKMAAEEEDEEDSEEEDEEDDDIDTEGNDVELRLARLEHLMDRRPLLLSSVLLRQNPHNVHEWAKRVALYKEAAKAAEEEEEEEEEEAEGAAEREQQEQQRQQKAAEGLRKVIVCYTEAVNTVVPTNPGCTGKPHTLWLSFARFYESHGDAASARLVLGKAVEVDYRGVDDLAEVWCAWGEMELRLAEGAAEAADRLSGGGGAPKEGEEEEEEEEEFESSAEASAAADAGYQAALEVMQRAVAEPPARRFGADDGAFGGTVQEKVHKSTKVWKLYLDLEESLGTVATTRAAYERMLELRIATPALLLNFASFLEEQRYFEESFTVYEKGVGAFRWPHVKPIWHQYLDKFLERYGGTKLERARELFEQAVAKVPAKEAAELFLKYAKLEENHGLVRHAMAVYDRATKAVDDKQKLSMYKLYIKKAESFYGVTRTREIHEQAIKVLADKDAQTISLDYAHLEKKLGEVDRARAIFSHGAQFDNPKRCPDYWKSWHEFEVAHGNEDTFRDMLRVKRSVQTAFASETFYDMAADVAAAEANVKSDFEAAGMGGGGGGGPGSGGQSAMDPMASAEQASLGGGKRKASEGGAAETEMEALERQAARITSYATQDADQGGATPGGPPAVAQSNPEEIDLDDEEEEEEENAEEKDGYVGGDGMRIAQRPVPMAVFGETLAKQMEEAKAKEAAEKEAPRGALDRFKNRG